MIDEETQVHPSGEASAESAAADDTIAEESAQAAAEISETEEETKAAAENAEAEEEIKAAAENAEAEEEIKAAAEKPAPKKGKGETLATKVKTREEEKRLAAIYMIFAAAIVFCVYIVQIFHILEEPLFSRVYYGNIPKVLYNACCGVVWIPMLVGVHLLLKKFTGYKAFHLAHRELPLKRILLLYACTVIPIFIVSAALGFELKIVHELGTRVTGIQVWSNASDYLYGGVKLLFFIIFIEILQEAGELLYKGKGSTFIPWGGIAAMLVFGFGDVIVAYATGAGVLFAWLYLVFDLLYGVIFLVSKKSYFATFVLSLIIYIL